MIPVSRFSTQTCVSHRHLHPTLAAVAEGILHPGRVLVISMDGTQQLKWGTPNFAEITKKDGVARLKSSLMICLMQTGTDHNCLVFDTLAHIRHDANLTIECIHRCMQFHQDKYGHMPRRLHLQTDNCTRENKNTYVLAYLSWLVERKVFDRINLSFLPVGHTHFICDQIASRFSVGIKHNTIVTRNEFHALLACTYSPRPVVARLDHVANMRELINPGLRKTFDESVCNIPHGLGSLQHFQFELDHDEHGTCLLTTKKTADELGGFSIADFRLFTRPNPMNPNEDIHTSGFSLADVEESCFKVIEPAKLRKIELNLENCRTRSGEEAYREQREVLKWLSNPVPIAFHWTDGGKYLPETEGRGDDEQVAAERPVDEPQYLQLRKGTRLYYSHAAKVAASPSDGICVGAYVACDARGDQTTELDFSIAQVVKFDPTQPSTCVVIR